MAALALALLVLASSAWNAVRIERVLDRALTDSSGVATRVGADSHDSYNFTRVLAAVAKDPFHPQRRRPGQRFQLPSDVASSAPSAAATVQVELIGTAVTPGGGFAMCATSGGAPRIVRVGERLGDWTLNRVTQGAAEFAKPDGAIVVLRIAKAGS
ncbi:MAG TPA: hypothetical protein VN803_00910 [Gemmatimonadales bacterium]|nr:hypothetical protein [Gemmatimonadales bacterium]